MKTQQRTQAQLHNMMARSTVLRVGATNDVGRRCGEYKYESSHAYHSGRTMYFAPTTNMKMAEDRLLARADAAGCSRNDHTSSNAQSQQGFVYVIR